MRALVVNKHAHPSQIPITKDAPEPQPTRDKVIVEIYSVALNFFDILQAQGKYQVQPPLPFVLGGEYSGKIAMDSPIPEGCPYKPGDRVFGFQWGAYAERCAADWKYMLPLPKNMTYDQGAGLHVTWPTSYEALVGRAALQPGEWVLVNAAAGGVGLAAVQLAKALGAKVVATVGSPDKIDVCKQYGADFAVNYTVPDWQKEVQAITNDRGVDVVYDPVGRIRDSLKCICWKGRAVVVGFAGGEIEKLPLNLVLLKNITVSGIYWATYEMRDRARYHAVWKKLLSLFESGVIKPAVYPQTYDLEHIADGLNAIEQRKTWGKVIACVRPNDSDSVQARL